MESMGKDKGSKEPVDKDQSREEVEKQDSQTSSDPEANLKNSEKVGEGKAQDKKKPQGSITLDAQAYDDLLNNLKALEGLRGNLLRQAADFENAKKRLVREKEDFLKFSQESFIRDILPVIDNFDRAFAHTEEIKDPNVQNIVTGIKMVLKQLMDILENRGLKRLETVGKKFDPHYHEAIGFVQEEGEEDEIIDEIESGYLLRDRLVRAAKVRVRIAPSANEQNQKIDLHEKEEEIT